MVRNSLFNKIAGTIGAGAIKKEFVMENGGGIQLSSIKQNGDDAEEELSREIEFEQITTSIFHQELVHIQHLAWKSRNYKAVEEVCDFISIRLTKKTMIVY
jgi:hypothetical protein